MIREKYNLNEKNGSKISPEILLNIIQDILVKAQIYLGLNEFDALNFEQKAKEIRNYILSKEKRKPQNLQIFSFQDIEKGIYEYLIVKKNIIFSKEDLSKIKIKTDEEIQQNLLLLRKRLEE